MSPPTFYMPSFVPSSVPVLDSIVDDKLKQKISEAQAESIVSSLGSSTDHTSGTINYDNTNDVPHNFDADRDPTMSDDYLDGWREGSRWYNISTQTLWVCTEATKHSIKWVKSVSEVASLFPEILEYSLPITSVGDNLYEVQLPKDLMIVNVLRVYVWRQCVISSGFNFNPLTCIMTLNMEYYPTENLDGKQAYITYVRKGYK